jgi:hypothetical protein
MSNGVSEKILRDIRDILWARAPGRKLPDADMVEGLRQILLFPIVQEAMARGNDSACNFVIRAVRTILADQTLPPRELVTRLQDLEPEVDRVLGGPDARMRVGPKKPPAS